MGIILDVPRSHMGWSFLLGTQIRSFWFCAFIWSFHFNWLIQINWRQCRYQCSKVSWKKFRAWWNTLWRDLQNFISKKCIGTIICVLDTSIMISNNHSNVQKSLKKSFINSCFLIIIGSNKESKKLELHLISFFVWSSHLFLVLREDG